MAEESTPTSRNSVIFAVMVILLHVASSIVYGVCIIYTSNYINVTSIFLCIGLAFLTVLGTFLDIKVLDLSSPI